MTHVDDVLRKAVTLYEAADIQSSRLIDTPSCLLKQIVSVIRQLRDLLGEIKQRDGACSCDRNPDTTNGPEEDCPWHGRPYGYWVDKVERLSRTVESIRPLAAAWADPDNGNKNLEVIDGS